MNLLYIWNDDYLNIERYNKTGFLLNSKYDVKYNEQDNRLFIEKNSNYVSRFWGENIFDVMAIVGDNGSGKTKIVNFLMLILKSIAQGECFFEFFAVFELEEDRFNIIATPKYESIKLFSYIEKNPVKKLGGDTCELIQTYKTGYFTNVLSLEDYRSRRYPIFDASIGGLLRSDYYKNCEMKYIDKGDNIIFNYYESQFLRTIKFIFSNKTNRLKQIFNMPQQIDVSINLSPTNEKFIISQLKKLNNEEINKILSETIFWDYFKPIFIIKTEITGLLVNLVITLFKEICIPSTTGDNRTEEAIKFLNILNQTNEFGDKNIYEVVRELIEKIANNINEKEHYSKIYKKYYDFVVWIEKNQNYFSNNDVFTSKVCSIPVKKENERFMTELLYHYERTNFAYQYLKFEFGLSTGEFNLLNIFANIYCILDIDENGKDVVINNTPTGEIKCTNLLLIFDEADLSLHPRWQQQYLYWLLKFIESVFPMCSVHVLIATHSPIMLSDFPQDNVIYLNDKEKRSIKREVKTFGSNIHNLFLDSFFLSDTGTIGEFAEKKINEIVKKLNENELSENEMEDIFKIINFVGDDLIRNQLLKLYNKRANRPLLYEKKEENSESIDMTINLLKLQKEQIERMIKELEQRKYDKNYN